jgi:hypothetical protein
LGLRWHCVEIVCAALAAVTNCSIDRRALAGCIAIELQVNCEFIAA